MRATLAVPTCSCKPPHHRTRTCTRCRACVARQPPPLRLPALGCAIVCAVQHDLQTCSSHPPHPSFAAVPTPTGPPVPPPAPLPHLRCIYLWQPAPTRAPEPWSNATQVILPWADLFATTTKTACSKSRPETSCRFHEGHPRLDAFWLGTLPTYNRTPDYSATQRLHPTQKYPIRCHFRPSPGSPADFPIAHDSGP